jgi:hypothetical protein
MKMRSTVREPRSKKVLSREEEMSLASSPLLTSLSIFLSPSSSPSSFFSFSFFIVLSFSSAHSGSSLASYTSLSVFLSFCSSISLHAVLASSSCLPSLQAFGSIETKCSWKYSLTACDHSNTSERFFRAFSTSEFLRGVAQVFAERSIEKEGMSGGLGESFERSLRGMRGLGKEENFLSFSFSPLFLSFPLSSSSSLHFPFSLLFLFLSPDLSFFLLLSLSFSIFFPSLVGFLLLCPVFLFLLQSLLPIFLVFPFSLIYPFLSTLWCSLSLSSLIPRDVHIEVRRYDHFGVGCRLSRCGYLDRA